ncbi:MAG: DUF3881 family protein [Lachnospiraceae bacterium]|jgi:hypothetical protein|nr:DUF3881 family protein [Lachnospiraceae bacterium]NBJ82919.1 DUF3881 family protein [bacterium 1XD42-76]NBK06210.1 DUF3881 family protein [bacterium 1XD42-94]
MHKFLRVAGFSMYEKKKEIEKLLNLLEKQPSVTKCVQIDEDTNVCEMRAEVAPGIGISMIGELNDNGEFEREFYFPFVQVSDESSKADCSVQRHAEKETYAGMVDETRIGISLIFYVQNFLDYREYKLKKDAAFKIRSVNLAGFSVSGKILLPIKKTQKQIQRAKVAAIDRSNLIEAAKNGDEDAMETLTIEDIDLYSQISRRAMKEDLYSIIDSCFMPCGIECDQYSIIGDIRDIQKIKNIYTKEEIYKFKVDCNDVLFTVCINSKDLLGQPEVGRRFKGQIWMQGILNFEEVRRVQRS